MRSLLLKLSNYGRLFRRSVVSCRIPVGITLDGLMLFILVIRFLEARLFDFGILKLIYTMASISSSGMIHSFELVRNIQRAMFTYILLFSSFSTRKAQSE